MKIENIRQWYKRKLKMSMEWKLKTCNFRLYHCRMFSIFISPTSLTFAYIIDTSFQFSFRWHLYLLSISFSHVFNFHSTNIFNLRLYHCRMFSIFISANIFNFHLYHCHMFSIFIPPTSLTFIYIIVTCFQFSFHRHLGMKIENMWQWYKRKLKMLAEWKLKTCDNDINES
jgi:hypothetical protein